VNPQLGQNPAISSGYNARDARPSAKGGGRVPVASGGTDPTDGGVGIETKRSSHHRGDDLAHELQRQGGEAGVGLKVGSPEPRGDAAGVDRPARSTPGQQPGANEGGKYGRRPGDGQRLGERTERLDGHDQRSLVVELDLTGTLSRDRFERLLHILFGPRSRDDDEFLVETDDLLAGTGGAVSSGFSVALASGSSLEGKENAVA